MSFSNINFKRLTHYPINIGYKSDYNAINDNLTTVTKAEIYTICV
jgi:hypothetical protein